MRIFTIFQDFLPAEWWKDEIQHHPSDHSISAVIIISSVALIALVWGKNRAVGMVITTFVGYPLVYKALPYVRFMSVSGTAQAVACVAIPLLTPKIPYLSEFSFPLYALLAYCIFVREKSLCIKFKEWSDELEALKMAERASSEKISNLKTYSAELEKTLSKLLDQLKVRNQVSEDATELSSREEDFTRQINSDYALLSEKIKKLTQLCKTAIDEPSFTALLSQVDEKEQKLSMLTSQCESKNKKLEILIQEISQLKDKLQNVLERATTQELQTGEKLEQVHTWIKALLAS